jgi:outer membrane biosynthesis protein TonB
MRKAAIISACVHVLVIALVYFGVPSLFRPRPVADAPVAVELVASLDQPPAETPAPPKAKPPPPPKVEPPPPSPPAPAIVEAPPPPEAVPLPAEKPKPKPKPVAKPKPPPKPAAKVAAAPPAPVPRRKPRPPPDQFQTLLKNLAKEKRTANHDQAKKAEKKPAPAEAEPFDAQKLVAALNVPSRRTSIDRQRLGSTLAAMVKQQVTPCWSIPGGAKDVQDMKIAVRIQLNPDGTLRGAPRLEDARRLQADPFYRAVAESALRALRNPRCSPLRLPLDQYDIWKDITFLFEPGEALGQ